GAGPLAAGAAPAVRRVVRAVRLDQLVAHAPDRLDARGGAAQLVAQPGDVDVHGPRGAGGVRPPDELTQALARQHHARSAGEHGEQLELLGPQLDAAVADRHLVAVRVDAQVADFQRTLPGPHARGAAQHGLHAGRQLARIERLGHVVVGAQLQPGDAVFRLVACREHDDWHVALLAYLAADLQPADAGQ